MTTRRPVCWLAICFVALAWGPLAALGADPAPEFQVVAHADAPDSVLSLAQLKRMFLKKEKEWSNGVLIRPVDQPVESEMRGSFNRAVMGKSPKVIASYWQRAIFGGIATPPEQKKGDLAVLEYVRSTPHSIGYVDARVELPSGVKKIRIDDYLQGEPAHLLEADRSFVGSSIFGVHASTLSKRGSARILTAGVCGELRDGGRQVVLENRHPEIPLSVRVQISRWLGDQFRSQAVKSYDVAPLSEVDLGCSVDGEKRRFDIVSVSDASVREVAEGSVDLPPRDMIEVIETGICGRDQNGKYIDLINLNPERSVKVKVRLHDFTESNSRTRIVPTRLAAGGEHRLGCTVDGKLSRLVTVVEASYGG